MKLKTLSLHVINRHNVGVVLQASTLLEEIRLTDPKIIAAAIAGCFAVLAAWYTWFLKTRDEKRQEKQAKRSELVEFYTDALSLFDIGANEVLNNVEFTLASDFSKMNAKMELLAPENITEIYFACFESFQVWRGNHLKGLRPKQEVGGMVITTFQSPDPREKYRVLAEETYAQLRENIEKLKKEIRLEIN